MPEDESCNGTNESLSEQVQNTIHHIDNGIIERHDFVDRKAEETSRLKKKVLKNLSFPAMNNGYSSISHAHPGTYNWVFNTTEFQTWRSEARTAGQRKALWINGKPGAGKSTMMKHMLDHCRKEMRDHAILSFFFNARGAPLESSMLGMLRSLVYQCIEQKNTLPKCLTQFLRKYRWQEKQDDWQWQIPELREFLFLAVQQLQKPVVILIDALDECEEPGIHEIASLLKQVLDLTALPSVPIRACMASRPRPLLMEMASKFPELTLHELSTTDIVVYVKESLITVNDSILIAIMEKASGCFLWVIIVVRMFNEAYCAVDYDAETIQMAVSNLPSDLANLFSLLLFPSNRGIGIMHSLLEVTLLSRRLLRPEELCAAIGLVLSDKESMRTQITKLSRGFIEIQQGQEPHAQVIHNSVREYLLFPTSLHTSRGLDCQPFRASHGRVWESCRTSLQQSMNNTTQGSLVDFNSGTSLYLNYAVEHILYHAEMAVSEQGEGTATYARTIENWLSNCSHWFDWLKKWLRIERQAGLLYILALNGFTNLAHIVLIQGADINAEGGLYGNAIQAAIHRGNKEIVKLLLERHVDVNPPSGLYGSALEAALYEGDEDIIKLLLEDDAVGDSQIRRCVNGLQAAVAVFEGDENLIDRFLDRGGDINAQGGFYGNVLQVAIFKSDWSTVSLLLRRGADMNALGGFFGYPLQAAAHTGNEATVTLLLRKGANVNAEGGHYGTALQAAASQNHVTIVKKLVSRGANPNAHGGEYGSALCAASYEGHLGVVKLLLEKGANPDMPGDNFGTALQAAACQGNLKVVELLIKNGADINTQGGQYGNALCAALVAANDDIVRLLLRHNARTDLCGFFNRTALHNAVKAGSHSMVRLLLEQGASPDDLDDTGTSPFDVAVQSRNSLLILELLPYTARMPLLSAKEWRKCLNWPPNSEISFCTSHPRSIHQNSTMELLQDLRNEYFAVRDSKVIPWKKDSFIRTMAKAYICILQTSDLLEHLPRSKFHCHWWMKTSKGRQRRGEAYETLWEWSLGSDTLPDDAMCSRLKAEEHFFEIGFKASCFKIAEEGWSALQSNPRGDDTTSIFDEGFLCIMAPSHPSTELQKPSSQSHMRSVYLLTTLDESPMVNPSDATELILPLIAKFKSIVGQNCVIANRQLSESRSQVLEDSGRNPKLLAQLLYDAQVLERIAENHKALVEALTVFKESLLLLKHHQWKLDPNHEKDLGNPLNEFVQLSSRIRELEEKSQSIIQLEFNLTSIVEAQRSTSTNKSMKRLSWITFVFLPLLFVSSLFGMNVDILANDPSWWLYLPLSGACTLSTLAVWLCFKRFRTLEGRLERHFWWLTGGEKQGDLEQGLTRSAKIRERTAQYSMHGKKRS